MVVIVMFCKLYGFPKPNKSIIQSINLSIGLSSVILYVVNLLKFASSNALLVMNLKCKY